MKSPHKTKKQNKKETETEKKKKKYTQCVLTHTLVPLLVLCISLWTAATETTCNILTTKLTPVITCTLIYI